MQLQVYAAMHAAVVSESKILAGHDVVKQLHSMLPHFQQVRFHLFTPGACGCVWLTVCAIFRYLTLNTLE